MSAVAAAVAVAVVAVAAVAVAVAAVAGAVCWAVCWAVPLGSNSPPISRTDPSRRLSEFSPSLHTGSTGREGGGVREGDIDEG